MKTKFIAVEGGEGSGKSTLTELFFKENRESMPLIYTREPGGSPYGEATRDLLFRHPHSDQKNAKTTFSFMYGARFDHIKNIIVPSMSECKHVLTDRFAGSTFAYNVAAESNFDPAMQAAFWAMWNLLDIKPDLHIFLNVDVEIGLRRAREANKRGREGNIFDDKDIEFHRKVHTGYRLFLSAVPHIVIDANRSFDVVKIDFIRQVHNFLVS